MMANWDNLNKEFFNLMESFQDSDWEKWENSRASRKEMRRLEFILKAKTQEEKLKLIALSSQANETFNQIVVSTNLVIITPSEVCSKSELAGEIKFALAA